MKLIGVIREDSIEPFLNVLKGLNNFTKFSNNALTCFRFTDKYLYLSGNVEKFLEIEVKIELNHFFYENYVIEATYHQIILMAYTNQLYQNFINIGNTKVALILAEKNDNNIFHFTYRCNVTNIQKTFECGVELLNPNLVKPKELQYEKQFSIICNLKKCYKVIKAYSKLSSNEIQIHFLMNKYNCDILFDHHSITCRNLTWIKNDIIVKEHIESIKKRKLKEKKREIIENDEDEDNYESPCNNVITKSFNNKILLKAFNVFKSIYSNNIDEQGLFKIILPRNDYFIALKLTNFESSGNWKVEMIIANE